MFKAIARSAKQYRELGIGSRQTVKIGVVLVALGLGVAFRWVPIDLDLKTKAYVFAALACPVVVLTGVLLTKLLTWSRR